MAKTKSTKPSRSRKTSAPAVTINPAVTLPLNALALSPDNVRKIYDPAAIEELARDIKHRGLLQSLSVRPLGESDVPTGYAVQGGGRRFRALQLLVDAGELAADTPIPCVLKTSGLAEEDSLAENTFRANLHPLDQYRAFAALLDKGKGEHDIAAAFQVTVTVVRQRLRLAAASPVLLEAFQNDDLSLDQLMAFCITTDHARQEAIWDKIKAQPYAHAAHAIKRLLTESTVPAGDRRATFVGIEAYEAAGGTIIRDLFDARAGGYLQDPDLLNRLVDEKLAATRDELLAKGWKWVVAALDIPYADKRGLDRLIPLDVTRPQEDMTRMAELEAAIDELEASDELSDDDDARLERLRRDLRALEEVPPEFPAEDQSRAGCFVTVTYDGDLAIDYGYVRPEDALQPSPEESLGEEGAVTTAAPASGIDAAVSETEEAAGPISDRLVQDLTAYHTVALRDAMANNFPVAFLALLHSLCLSHFYHDHSRSCLQLDMRSGFPATAPGLDTWTATKAVDARDLAWRKLLPDHARDLWQTLAGFDENDSHALFAHCVATTVNTVREPHNKRPNQIAHGKTLAGALGLHMVSAGWTTTVANYLGRVTKPLILEAIREAKGDDAAHLIEHLKKDDMAREAERLLQGTGWLPPLLRTLPADVAETACEDTDLPAFLAEDTAAQGGAEA